jgi:hypothetical protein
MKIKNAFWLLLPVLLLAALGVSLQTGTSLPQGLAHSLSGGFDLVSFLQWGSALAVLVLRLSFWGLLIAFALWVKRHVRLPSVPWLLAYSILNGLLVYLLPFLIALVLDSPSTQANTVPLNRSDIMVGLSLWSNVIHSVNALLATLLLMSEAVFVLNKAGVEPDRKWVRQLLRVRDYSAVIGSTMIGLLLLFPLGALIFRLM